MSRRISGVLAVTVGALALAVFSAQAQEPAKEGPEACQEDCFVEMGVCSNRCDDSSDDKACAQECVEKRDACMKECEQRYGR